MEWFGATAGVSGWRTGVFNAKVRAGIAQAPRRSMCRSRLPSPQPRDPIRLFAAPSRSLRVTSRFIQPDEFAPTPSPATLPRRPDDLGAQRREPRLHALRVLRADPHYPLVPRRARLEVRNGLPV